MSEFFGVNFDKFQGTNRRLYRPLSVEICFFWIWFLQNRQKVNFFVEFDIVIRYHLANLFIPFAFAKPDFTFPNTKLRQIGENWEAIMMTQEETVGDIQELKGDIRELKGEIGELKGEIGELKEEIGELENKQQQLTPTDSSLAVQISNKTALLTAMQNSITATRKEIAAKENRLTALINSQQGNFLFT